MSFSRYPEYRDSGVEWLGEVPAHWNSGRLKHLLRIRGGQDYKAVESENTGGYPVIGSGGPFTYATDYLYDGESILLGRKGTIDKPLYIVGRFWTVDTMFYTEVLSRTSGRYAYYAATTIPFSHYSTNTALPSMSQFDLSNHALALPPHAEQSRIARFLDHEIAKIDTLIHEQERLIALLKEKRQAVISHAVTKGLDPDVPMKDSGVEWLGEVPAHWRLPKLTQVTSRIGDGLHSTPSYEDGTGYFFINGNNLVNGRIKLGQTSKEVPRSEYRKHCVELNGTTLLISINGTVGNLGLYHGEPAILGKSACYINCKKTLDRQFLMIFMRSDDALHYFDLEVTGTTIYNLSLNSIRQMKLCLPPKAEQNAIVQYCQKHDLKFEALIGHAQSTTSLLSERRAALISAAVTGKIDVRQWIAHMPNREASTSKNGDASV